MAHLGMSGQLLVEDSAQPDEKHLKVRLTLSPASDADGSPMPAELRFVDQRIFGGMFLADLAPTRDGHAGGISETGLPLIPVEASHIARDPLDPAFSFDAFYKRLRARKTGIKRAILDQAISGVGNIYADEALWAAKLHFARPTEILRRRSRTPHRCLPYVIVPALEAGGTSFDSLYVNVNGASGYFERPLNAYGREGEPCYRCRDRAFHEDPSGHLHEPFVLHLPRLPAAPAQRPLVNASLRGLPSSPTLRRCTSARPRLPRGRKRGR